MTERFTYERKNQFGYSYIRWEIRINDYTIVSEARSIRQAYRHAKRALRRRNNMIKYIERFNP